MIRGTVCLSCQREVLCHPLMRLASSPGVCDRHGLWWPTAGARGAGCPVVVLSGHFFARRPDIAVSVAAKSRCRLAVCDAPHKIQHNQATPCLEMCPRRTVAFRARSESLRRSRQPPGLRRFSRVAVSVAVKRRSAAMTHSHHRRSEGSRRPDLNREPPDYKSGALPIAPRRRDPP